MAISKSQIYILASAAGISVANIYYSQPILSVIANDLGLRESEVGNLPIFSQAGYGLGLLLLTPLGDKMDRKRLIIFFQVLLILTLSAITIVQNIYFLYLLNFMIGFFAVATQIIMPFAASMAGNAKGKIVGIVFTGVLVGILGARTISGFIAEQWAWQDAYLVSAGMLAISCVLIALFLPSNKGTYQGSYGSLIMSSIGQLKRFAALRRSVGIGVLVFGAFCSFWTTLTFHLSGEPFHYDSNTIGLFGILGIGGALIAPLFGRMSDKHSPPKIQVWTISLVLLSIAAIALLPTAIAAFVVAIILLDVGVQATQVINLATNYTLDETAHSRINTIYMTLMFIGGALGTYAGVKVWQWYGWQGVCAQLALWSLGALVISFFSKRKTHINS